MRAFSKPPAPPGPKGGLIRGNAYQFRSDPLGFLEKTAANYGDIATFRVFRKVGYFLNNPSFIRHVLVDNYRNYRKGPALGSIRRLTGNGLLASDGDFHLRQRRLIQPAFHRMQVAAFADMMVEFTSQHIARWSVGETRDLHAEIMQLTMSIVAKALFDANLSSEANELGAIFRQLIEDFRPTSLSVLGPWFGKLPTLRNRRREHNAQVLDKVIYGLIKERRVGGEPKGDLLSLLLAAQDVEGDSTGITDRQLRDEMMTLFVAGHETIGNALTWTFYLLSEHPSVAERLKCELDNVLNGHAPTVDHLEQLPYTRMVLSEAMRLYPPVWAQVREAIGPDEIGGYPIKPGMLVLVSQWVMHRNPVYWKDPEVFRPERFDHVSEQSLLRYTYFPFGCGPRQCVGESFAWMEGMLLMATIIQSFRFEPLEQEPAKLDTRPALRPKNGLLMKLKEPS